MVSALRLAASRKLEVPPRFELGNGGLQDKKARRGFLEPE